MSGKLRVSARTLTCPGPNGSRIWRNICCSKVAVDLILEEAACGIAAFNLERQAAGRLLNRFPVSAKMRPYIVRLRLNAHHLDPGAAVEFNQCVERMRAILVRHKVPLADADRAIQETLQIAIDQQPYQLWFEQRPVVEDHSRKIIDELISSIQELRRQIKRLPPASLAVLNRHLTAVLEKSFFDTEVFIDVLDATVKALRHVSPKARADEAYSTIYPPVPEGWEQSRPLVNFWESMPAVTRVEVERLMRSRKPPTSLVDWLNTLGQLLQQERPVRKKPPSVVHIFTKRTILIWERLGLHPTLKYDADKGHEVESDYQRFCNLALAAVGDTSKLSRRQVSKAKTSLSGSSNPK